MATSGTERHHGVARWFVALMRCRGAAAPLGVVLMAGGVLLAALAPEGLLPAPVRLGVPIAGVALIALGVLVNVLPIDPATRSVPARTLYRPVAGVWEGCNSPVDGVPSHGTHGYGQTYAIDLVPRPAEQDDADTHRRGSFRRPETFPGFGQPLRAPTDGTVVAVYDRARDHRSRQGWLGYAAMAVEGMLRDLAGSRALLGNHVILACPDTTTYVALAHLRRGSAAVRVGEHVHAGQLLGECGNSGNSTEPHLHLQLMDHPRPSVAAGLRFTLDEFESGGEHRRAALPANGERIRAAPAGESR